MGKALPLPKLGIRAPTFRLLATDQAYFFTAASMFGAAFAKSSGVSARDKFHFGVRGQEPWLGEGG